MIKACIGRLAEGKSISGEEAYGALRAIMTGEATPAQIAAFITALRIRGETPDIIAGAARAMREQFTAVEPHHARVVDTCGTGGDGAHTFNISTAAALVTAGAGVPVAKHGNKSVSSHCGSADVLAELGVNITVDATVMSACLKEVGIAFLFAPSLHPAMKHAIGPRREIGIRTIFNILGPLSNPAGAKRGVLGVYSKDLATVLAEALVQLGAEHMFVVHGEDGLDEISIAAPTHLAEVRDGAVRTYRLHPSEYGIKPAKPEDLRGGDPADNATIIRAVLDGQQGPRRDIVLLNAAVAIMTGEQAASIEEGIKAAANAIDSGAARAKLEQLITFTQK
jgi:anthranilate phosphoribosyltransferase